MKDIVRFTLVAMMASAFAAPAQTKVGTVLGTWKGESKCIVKPSACHDEVVVYTIAESPDSKDFVDVQADKIVNGVQQNMGTLECAYRSKAGILVCDMPDKGIWAFHVQGDTMTGTLKLAEGTLFRKVNVKRVPR